VDLETLSGLAAFEAACAKRIMSVAREPVVIDGTC